MAAAYGGPVRRGGTRFGSSKAAKVKGAKSLPPRRSGKSKVLPGASNPMAHGGNC